MLSNITVLVSSPAQGAMYAPLALKFVYGKGSFSMSDSLFPRALVHQITANPVTTGTSSKPKSQSQSQSQSHIDAIAGGAVGGVLAIGAITLVVRRRRRRSRRRRSLFKRDVVDPGLPVTMTPFKPTPTGAAEPETAPQTNWQQQRTEAVEPEIVPLVHALTPLDLPMPFPVGLSGKELARLRAESSHSPLTSPDALPSGPLLTATAERKPDTSSSEARRLQSEVESLRREVQQIRAEIFESPPGYEAYEDGGA